MTKKDQKTDNPSAGINDTQAELSHELLEERLHRAVHEDAAPRNRPFHELYGSNDFSMLQDMAPKKEPIHTSIRSLDDLLERDRIREQDGFPRKIKIGKLVKPVKGSEDKVIVVPTTVEEKFIHDNRFLDQEAGGSGSGHGSGEEGDVIGEQPVRTGEGEGSGAGQGQGGSHEIDANAYDLGRILTEKFQLPNLKDKGKKRSLTRYTYDLTDKNRSFGQVLDKKATLRQVLQTNIGLQNISDPANIDPTGLLIAPKDRIYRILSREMDYESQAMVFLSVIIQDQWRERQPSWWYPSISSSTAGYSINMRGRSKPALFYTILKQRRSKISIPITIPVSPAELRSRQDSS